jgi:hypothetical protein
MLLAVVYDTGSAGPLEVVRAAEDLCEVIFLVDRTLSGVREAADLLEELDLSRDITGLSAQEIADRLRGWGATAILTFSEYRIGLTAEIAALSGLPYHSPEAAHRLTHKAGQRHCLSEAGVETIRFRTITSLSEARPALAEVGLPAVVKPTVGAASRNAFPIESAARWSEVEPALRGEAELIIEQLLVGDPEVAGHDWGDYVSVEAVSLDGEHHCIATVGKFPLTPPFREGGMVFPATLGDPTREAVTRLAFEALTALGVSQGISQIEIKLTPQGPRLIEVNGRLGGYVGDILRRATGMDLVRTAILAALGDARAVDVPESEPCGVTYSYFLPTPTGRVRLTALYGFEKIKAMSGVTSINLRAPIGALLDSSQGTQAYLGVVRGQADDHASLVLTAAAMRSSIDVDYEQMG